MPADDRDRELLTDLRRVVEKTTQFIERVEVEDLAGIKLAENLTSLARMHSDIAAEMRGRAAALNATHPYANLPRHEPRDPPKND